jgi:pilus assembly protein CpaD
MPRLSSLVWLLGAGLALTGCAHKTTAWIPDSSIIPVVGNTALLPDCRPLAEPSTMRDGILPYEGRATIAFGCATYSNLARMVANPRDLVNPRGYPGQDAVNAGAAVQRYHENKVTPLSDSTTTSVMQGSTTGGGGTGQ